MAGWVFLAFRDSTLLGAGERLEDAQQVCLSDAFWRAKRRERVGLNWYAPQRGHESSHEKRGSLIVSAGLYSVRRVPVARYAVGDGG
jgi:hypothetical protein